MSPYECGTGCTQSCLRCCCSADAAVGRGELCPSADVGGVRPVARQLWAGASPVPSQISASGKVPAGKVRAAALAPACNARPSLAPPAATNTMRRGVRSQCRCGRGGPSPVAGVEGMRPALVQMRAEAGRSGPWADVGGVSPAPVHTWDAISPVSWQISAEESPIPSQIGASGFADTSGKGPGC